MEKGERNHFSFVGALSLNQALVDFKIYNKDQLPLEIISLPFKVFEKKKNLWVGQNDPYIWWKFMWFFYLIINILMGA